MLYNILRRFIGDDLIKILEKKSYYKESHPNKKLGDHISEMKNFSKLFVERFGLKHLEEFIELLIELHDIGKLDDSWSLSNKRPRHSIIGMIWINRRKDFFVKKLGEYYHFLLYFVYRHHSLLTKKSLNIIYLIDRFEEIIGRIPDELSEDFDTLRNIIKGLSIEKKIDIIDSFGIFKTVDILSASNVSYEYVKRLLGYKIVEEDINKFLKSYVSKKGKRIDIEKLNVQKGLYKNRFAIFIAPTGWGKTTGCLFFGCNGKKMFITLPTITAIREYYESLSNIFMVDMYFYLYDAYLSIENTFSDKLLSYNISKNMLYPIMITTIDQILLTFLQSGKYFLRRFNFRDACFIFDEFHILSPQMIHILLHFLKIYGKIYNLRALFMSATFPKAIIFYLKKYINNIKIFDISNEYKHLRRVLFEYKNEDIYDWISKNIDFLKNKKVLIIVNLVDKAIKIYKLLKDYYNVEILHSRFMFRDRLLKERNIRNVDILVSTQVSEVSLDISFDFLLTELSPIPSLIQRFGRVNRYGKYTSDVNCYIFKPKECGEMKVKYRPYPYSLEEISISENIVEKLSKSLKNEYQLIEVYNKTFTYEKFLKLLNEEIMDGYNIRLLMKEWENVSEYFYTTLPEDYKTSEIIDELFNLRGSTNILCLLHPDMIDDEALSNEISNIMEEWEKRMSFNERLRIYMKLKEYLIPVPIYIIRRNLYTKHIFPVIKHNSLRYSREFGLYNESETEDLFL